MSTPASVVHSPEPDTTTFAHPSQALKDHTCLRAYSHSELTFRQKTVHAQETNEAFAKVHCSTVAHPHAYTHTLTLTHSHTHTHWHTYPACTSHVDVRVPVRACGS